jgi:hypothetical protein
MHLCAVNLGVVPFLYVFLGLFCINFFLGLGVPLSSRAIHRLWKLFHHLFQWFNVLLFFFDCHVSFVQGLTKLEHLIEQFLSLWCQCSHSLLHLVVLFHRGVRFDNSLFKKKYFLKRSVTTFYSESSFFSFSYFLKKSWISWSFLPWINAKLRWCFCILQHVLRDQWAFLRTWLRGIFRGFCFIVLAFKF